ncbi:MAG: sigma 54-interacting transcriptional regulator [Maledivibacter sp.]|jgi:transcriptional regulator with PAS, ATPase and Fis domain|nr:sigma 54-interacting transcriptional regulator [Maledivibacter sp.]
MYLAEIKDIVSKFAETIAKILDIDVMIVDSNCNKIANTFKYIDDSAPIARYSMLGEVLHTGKVVAVKDKTTYKHCKICSDISECIISGLVSVPIFYEKNVIGAIALLVPINKTSPVFENLQNSIDFLERMSDLLSSKLKNIDDYNKLNVIKKERETIIDVIEDGLVFINNNGRIIHYNHQFESFFKFDKNVEGDSIDKLIDHPLMHEILMFSENISYKTFYYEHINHSFYGFVSCRNIMLNGNHYGALLTFKSLGKAYKVFNEISDNRTHVSFGDIQGNDPKLLTQINNAKQLAVTDENILIFSEPGFRKQMLARAIHNFSDREKNYFVEVDCDSIPYDMLEAEIFGHDSDDMHVNPGIGKIRMAHRGTLFFKNISKMPLYLQRRLVEVMKTKELRQRTYKGFNIDVRMIFDTCEVLSPLVEQGTFDEELYFRISKNTITIPSLLNRKGDIKIIVNDIIDKLKIKYLKPHVKFDKKVLSMMYKYTWPKNVYEIEKTIDVIIAKAKDDIVTVEDIKCFKFAGNNGKEVKVVDEIEKDLIKKMLTEYKSKEQIAKAMGIGRATLYRKMKKYGLS